MNKTKTNPQIIEEVGGLVNAFDASREKCAIFAVGMDVDNNIRMAAAGGKLNDLVIAMAIAMGDYPEVALIINKAVETYKQRTKRDI